MMFRKIIIIITGLFIGFGGSFLIVKYGKNYVSENHFVSPVNFSLPFEKEKNQIIGFLPYWLTDKANKDYTKYITTLTYYGLTVTADGTILKLSQPGEAEPGWLTLNAGKMNPFFDTAKKNNIKLSLLIFSSDEETIGQLISNPIPHAQNLVTEINPIMKRYGFTDLNLDIESVLEASGEARQNFTTFVREIKKNLNSQKLGTLTVDASPIVLIKNYLINPKDVGRLADTLVLMTYDYHYPGSYVTGPVSPVGGAEIEAEFDSETAIKEALKILPAQKILLGLPLYGYEWETIGDTPRSAVIPGTGVVISNRRMEQFIATCASCSAQLDNYGKESYVVYKDLDAGTFHQIFYPDINATTQKISLSNHYQLGGIALWALGYEGDSILNPIEGYKNSN